MKGKIRYRLEGRAIQWWEDARLRVELEEMTGRGCSRPSCAEIGFLCAGFRKLARGAKRSFASPLVRSTWRDAARDVLGPRILALLAGGLLEHQ